MKRILPLIMLLAGLALSAVPAKAQPIATFRWQLLPYCNVVSLAVTQSGGVFRLDGTDTQCGAATQASTAGVAFFNPNGSIGLGFTIVGSPGGAPVHVDATIDLSTLNGTWRDSAGNNGTFIATPGAGVGGPPRPLGGGAVHETAFHAFGAAARGNTSFDIGGCRSLDPAGLSNLLLGLSLPRGAVITEVSVKLSDTSNDAAISAVLVGDDYPDGAIPGVVQASHILAAPNGAHSHVPLVLIPGAVTPVSATRSYHLDVSAPAHTGMLYFCGAIVRYTIDPTAAADSAEVVKQ